MADGTVRGTFALEGRDAISTLHSIRDAGLEADASLDRLGRRMDAFARSSTGAASRVSTSWGAMRRTIDSESDRIAARITRLETRLERFGRIDSTASVKLRGFDEVNAQLSELEMRLDRLDHRRTTTRVSVRGAGATSLAGGGGGTGGGGHLLSSLGGIPGALPWWAAAAPIAPQLLGGATALLGSASSAVMGAGTVGLGAIGALASGGALTYLAAHGAVQEVTALTKAQQAYTQAVRQYGSASSQAAHAARAYNAALAANPGAAPAARALATFRSDYRTAMAPARGQFYRGMAGVFNALTPALPTIGRYATTATGATASAATSFAGFAAGPQSMQILGSLTSGFARELPIAERSLQNILLTFGHLSVDALPFFHEANVWVEHWTSGLAKASSNQDRVQSRMRGFVTSAKDWGGLLSAVYRTVRDIFNAGTPSGNSMVVQLTSSINSWDQWINRNPQKVQTFFLQAERGVERIATVVGNLVKDVSQLFNMLQPILSRAEQFLSFASGMGPGGLSVLAAGAYGGYNGLRGAIGGLPSAGSLARSYVLGGASFGTAGRMSGGTTLTPAPAISGPFANLRTRLSGGGRLSRMAGMGLGLGTAALGGVARTVAPMLAINAALDMLGASGGLWSHLGAGLSGLTGNMLSPQAGAMLAPGLAGAGSAMLAQRVAAAGLRQLAFSGVGPEGLSVAAARGSSLLSGGVSTGSRVLSVLGSGALRFGLPVVGAYAGLMMNPDNAGASPALVSHGNAALVNHYVARVNATQTPAEIAQVRRDLAREMQNIPFTLAANGPNAHQNLAQLRAQLAQLSASAAKRAGDIASNQWQTSFTTGLSRGVHPDRAVSMWLSGIPAQFRKLGPEGSTQFARDTAQWVGQMEQEDPKLRGPLQRLMAGIIRDLDDLHHHVTGKFSDMRDQVVYFNGQIYKNTDNAWGDIRDSLVNKASVAQEKLLGIFGTIQREAVDALTSMGFSRSQARTIVTQTMGGGRGARVASSIVAAVGHGAVPGTIPTSTTSAYGPFSAPNATHATGGRLGGLRLPGVGSLDTVPVFGGYGAPGELILNHWTERDVNRDLAAVGKPTLEQRVSSEQRRHSDPFQQPAPKQGIMPGFSTGGALGAIGSAIASALGGVGSIGGGPVGNLPAMIAMANQIASHHYPYRWGGGHNSSFAGPYDCSGAVSAVLHAGGALGSPEVAQQFMSYGLPGPGDVTLYASPSHVYMSLAGRYFGTSTQNPGGGADWFSGGPRPGFVQRHIRTRGRASGLPSGAGGGPSVVQIPALRSPSSGLAGIPGALADRGGQIYAAGMTQRINQILGAYGGGGGGSTAGLSGSLVHMVDQLAGRFGWSGQIGDWLRVINRESGGSMTATNASSGAYGIAQFINGAGEYAQYGGNSTTMAGQLLAMANYIRQRYGTPSAAWAHEMSAGWYNRGGRLPSWGGWHAKGGDWITNGPTLFGAGERGRERVTVSPVSNSTGGRTINVHFNGPVHIASEKDIEALGREVAGKILDALDEVQSGVSDKQLQTMGAGNG